MLSVSTRWVEDRALLGRARTHSVVTDRPETDGGHDQGCTSGELMLLAVGSCVVGSIVRCAAERRVRLDELRAHLSIADFDGDGYEPIEVSVEVRGELAPEDLDAVRQAAGSGRVTGRLSRSTDVRIRVTRLDQPAATRR